MPWLTAILKGDASILTSERVEGNWKTGGTRMHVKACGVVLEHGAGVLKIL